MSSTTHLVSTIDTAEFGAETLRVGDLNGDGAPDLLFVQSVFETREITCLTAATIFGEPIWRRGVPSPNNGRIYSDLPVQVYDWNGDGHNEAIYVRQARYVRPEPREDDIRQRAFEYDGNATVVVLDAASGAELKSFPIPAAADDSIAFADLTGRGRRQDLVVKDRYWNLWGISYEGEQLWRWEGSTGHYPAVADLDDDGKDEVFVGFALLDHDGKVIFQKDTSEAHHGHADATYVMRAADGAWRLFFGNHGLHCLNLDGSVRWFHPVFEAQHVVCARFRPDSQFQVAVVNRGHPRTLEGKPAELLLYDPDGRELWRQAQPPGSWGAAMIEIDWLGDGLPKDMLVYSRGPDQPVVIYDGNGNIIDELEMRYTPDRTEEDRKSHFYVTRADVCGDSREEVILFGSRGACVWANARALAVPTLYNNTLYPGM